MNNEKMTLVIAIHHELAYRFSHLTDSRLISGQVLIKNRFLTLTIMSDPWVVIGVVN
jgi:hypothetical protein